MSRNKALLLAIGFFVAAQSSLAAELRTSKHDDYGRTLWKYVNDAQPWTHWTPALVGLQPAHGPRMTAMSRAYVNSQGWTDPWAHGSLIVARHYATPEKKGNPVSLSVWYRVKKDYDAKQNDWYWAHYLADGTLLATSVDKNPYFRRGFVAVEREDRLWVFPQSAPEIAIFLSKGKLATSVKRGGAGPNGKTLVALNQETIEAYLAAGKKL